MGAIVLASTAVSNAAGAPANAAKDGCTCHGAAASPMASVTIGLPDTYVRGKTYNGTITVSGPAALPVGQNQGGFALQASAGQFQAKTGTQGSGLFLTHTAQGNDRRSWDFSWTAPTDAEDVTFWLAGNAVNGDGTSNDQFDRWAKIEKVVPREGGGPPAANATSASATPQGDDSAALPFVGVFAVLAAAALWRRR